MENYIDDFEAYQRLMPNCVCGCKKHCGHSCLDCDSCTECECPSCRESEKQ